MAEGLFSIFSDSHPFHGAALKENVPSSRKKALRDVKNTFGAHNVSKSTGKLGIKSTFGDPATPPAKDCNSVLSVYLDNDDSDSVWEYCKCYEHEDDNFQIGSCIERPNNEDIKYLMGGIFHIASSDCNDCEQVLSLPYDAGLFSNDRVCLSPEDVYFPSLDLDLDLQPSYIELEDEN